LEKKLFWIVFLGLSLLADASLPFFWGNGRHPADCCTQLVARLPQRMAVLKSSSQFSVLSSHKRCFLTTGN
jgi:hypothetical protein